VFEALLRFNNYPPENFLVTTCGKVFSWGSYTSQLGREDLKKNAVKKINLEDLVDLV
jgi:hypothetical protein